MINILKNYLAFKSKLYLLSLTTENKFKNMKPYLVNLINAICLIMLSSWGYFTSETPSMTALIPTFIGIILLFSTLGIKKENKVIAHIAVLFTFIILIGLIKPLLGALEREDIMAVGRVSIMLLGTTVALITFIRSFIEARKKKEQKPS